MRRVALVLFLVAAGCLGESPGPPAVPDLDFTTLSVETTATEPWEARRPIHVAWGPDAFAVESEGEDDLPRYAMRVGDTFYATESGMGWTSYSEREAMERGALSNRLRLWDLRYLLTETATEVETSDESGTTLVQASGVASFGGRPMPWQLTLQASGRRIESVDLASEVGRESPFTFRATPDVFPLALGTPSPALPAPEVRTGNDAARAAHDVILALVADYQARHAGTLPSQLDPETLRIELLLAGEAWPVGAFDGEPMRAGGGAGHFAWRLCTATTGYYTGLGWDGAVETRAFGSGCGPAPSGAAENT